LWNGKGAVRLLRHDAARRTLLIERARPGTDASSLGDADAIREAVRLGRALWRDVPEDTAFTSAFGETRGGLDSSGVPSHPYVVRARELLAHLEQTSTRRVLLHGDFHHHNL